MNSWDFHINAKKKFFTSNLFEFLAKRDLILMFVKRDVITIYKQTILGPIWFLLQPILTMLVYIFVFGNIAGISTDGLPHSLFYLSGIILWNYFAECFQSTSDTFFQNNDIFSKVYFPRVVIPASKLISGFIKFIIQFILFICIYLFYYLNGEVVILNWYFVIISPLLVFSMGFYALGLGLFFSSLTSKYRDLKFLLQFGIQLLMFATPIIYPLSSLSGKALLLMKINPFTYYFEAFKFIFLGKGVLSLYGLIYSSVVLLFVMFTGLFFFNKAEKDFVDTI